MIDERLRERFDGLSDEAIRERLIEHPEDRAALRERDLETLRMGWEGPS